jgi:hypothetical protein
LIIARAQISRHIREGDVGDARIEHLHERRECHDNRNQPRIVLRLPDILFEGESSGTHSGKLKCSKLVAAELTE